MEIKKLRKRAEELKVKIKGKVKEGTDLVGKEHFN